MNKLDLVKSYSASGYNCGQSILAAFGEDYGLKKELAFKLGVNLGMGCAYRGEMCGAVAAALLIYGLKYGSDKPNDELSNEIVYQLSNEHIKEFEELHNSVQCKDLLGYSPNIPEELNEIISQKLFLFKCPNFISDSVRILESKIEKTKK